jgi:hypothetical protein
LRSDSWRPTWESSPAQRLQAVFRFAAGRAERAAWRWSGWRNRNPAVYLVGTVNVSADHPGYEEVQRKSGKLPFDTSYPCHDLRNSN